MITIIHDDLLNSDSKYICHQCNCVTTNSRGLSKYIFDRYPECDTYSSDYIRIPGTISVHKINNNNSDSSSDSNGNDTKEQYIINIYGQKYPGKPKHKIYKKNRIKWFKRCLDKISELDVDEISIPYKIGCGLAGGNWNEYLNIIKEFSRDNNISVMIYRIN